jgi:hypothetical protein
MTHPTDSYRGAITLCRQILKESKGVPVDSISFLARAYLSLAQRAKAAELVCIELDGFLSELPEEHEYEFTFAEGRHWDATFNALAAWRAQASGEGGDVSELTLREIDAAIAVKVMAFIEVVGTKSGPRWRTPASPCGIYIEYAAWHPTTDIEQAFQVLAHIGRKEWQATIYAGDRKLSCVVFKNHVSEHKYGDTVAEAICRAVLAALEGGE